MAPHKTGRAAPEKEAQAPAQPTAAHAWNLRGLYQLPSGNVAELERKGVLATAGAANGRNLITDAALLKLNMSSDAPKTDEERAATIRANGHAYSEMAKLCFVSPRVVDEHPKYENNEIAVSDIADFDLLWLFYDFVNGDVAALATFRLG